MDEPDPTFPAAPAAPSPGVSAERRVSEAPKTRDSAVARALAVGAVALGVGVILGYVAKPDSSSEPFVNFDPESTPAALLASGWSGFEAMPSGDTFVWCASKSCVLDVPAGNAESRIVRVRLWPFQFPSAPTQTVEVSVNGTSLGTQPLTALPSVLSFPAAKGVFRKGPNEVRFGFAYAVDPKSQYTESDDPRQLAAAFDWVEVARPPAAPPPH